MTTLLPVHCCCDPKVRLGWIPVATRSQHVGERLSFIIRRAGATLTGYAPLRGDYGTVEHVPAERIDTEVSELVEPPANGDFNTPGYEWRHTLAVKSAHHPIETWRRVPGFIDDTMMTWLRDAFLRSIAHERGSDGEAKEEAE
jgi:hypothetical protein